MIPYPLPKQIADKAIAGVLTLVLLPFVGLLLLVLAIDMLVSPADRGSVLVHEPRVSQGETFELLKFRTLRDDGDTLTWSGRRILKPLYLDELPQLLNVLRGDISLVGPRPWPPSMVERQVAAGLDYRNRVVAGLTGTAQVTKGQGRSYAELDLAYVDVCRRLGGWALVRYDLRVLARTPRVLARAEGLRY